MVGWERLKTVGQETPQMVQGCANNIALHQDAVLYSGGGFTPGLMSGAA